MRKELTLREQEILNLLMDGLHQKEIAHRMSISARTVDFHRNNIYRKLGVHSIQELLTKRDAGQNIEAAVPAEPQAAVSIKNGNLKRLIPFGMGILIGAFFVLFVLRFFIKPSWGAGGNALGSFVSAKKPFVLALNDNEPWGYTFYYPLDTQITKDDIYTVSYSFVSNIDIGLLNVWLFDTDNKENQFNPRLSTDVQIKSRIKANVKYSGSITITATKTSSSAEPNANLLVIDAHPYTIDRPVLTFSKFEIVKSN